MLGFGSTPPANVNLNFIITPSGDGRHQTRKHPKKQSWARSTPNVLHEQHFSDAQEKREKEAKKTAVFNKAALC